MSPKREVVEVMIGLLLGVIGVALSRVGFDAWGEDFAPQYMSAWMVREGLNVYDFAVQTDGYMRHIGHVTTWAHFYPPAASVAALPATLVPYPIARELWFVVAYLVMFVGVWRFLEGYFPAWSRSRRVLIIGALCCAAAIRWGFKVAQPGSIVLGLFGLFLVEIRRDKTLVPLLCGVLVVSFKVTFGLPFFLIAAARGRYTMVAFMLFVWGVLNIVGLWAMGGPEIITDYMHNMAELERPDQLNYPDPRGGNSLARTDWPYLLNTFVPSLSVNKVIGHVLSVLAFSWLGWEVWAHRTLVRAGSKAVDIALAASATALSLLVVYHHHYDMSLLLLPLIAIAGSAVHRRQPAAWWYILPVVAYAGLYPYAIGARAATWVLGVEYGFVAKALAVCVCLCAFISSTWLLHVLLREESAAASRAPSEVPLSTIGARSPS